MNSDVLIISKAFDMTDISQLSRARVQGETFLNMTPAQEGGLAPSLLNQFQLSHSGPHNFPTQKLTNPSKWLLENFARPVEIFLFESIILPDFSFFLFWNLKILCFTLYRWKIFTSDYLAGMVTFYNLLSANFLLFLMCIWNALGYWIIYYARQL